MELVPGVAVVELHVEEASEKKQNQEEKLLNREKELLNIQ